MKLNATSPQGELQDPEVAILHKAAGIFYLKGYDATSMSDLATAFGVTKAGLYYYVESKEDLLFKIMQNGLDWLERDVLEPAGAMRDPQERLRWMIRRHARKLLDGSHIIPLMTDELAALTPKHRQQIEQRMRVYFDVVRDTIRALPPRTTNGVDPTVATFGLFGMLLWLPRWYRADGVLEAEEVVEGVARLFFNGLVKPGIG